MKKEYPNYKNILLEAVLNKQTKKNKELIKEFLEYCKITASENSIKKISGKIIQIADIINKPLDSLGLEDLRKFLMVLNQSDRAIETQNDTKKILKRFIKWKYEDWSKRFKELKEVRTKNGINHDKLNSSTILTEDELQMLIGNIESLKYKSLILLMYESAGRPEEILKLKWKDINLDEKEVKLDSSKTGRTRTNPINQSAEHLRRYKQECFFPTAKAESCVFPSSNNKEKPLSVQALNDFMNKLEKRLNFNKHIFPYLLRHTRLTTCIKKLSPKVYEDFAGHSLEVGMRTYAHLNNDDVKKEMNEKVFKIEKITRKDKQRIEQLEDRINTFERVIKVLLKRHKGIIESVEKTPDNKFKTAVVFDIN